MQTWQIVVIVVAGLVVLALIAWGVWAWQQAQHRKQLHERYGSEYDRLAEREGSKRAAAELADREQRHDQLELRDLPPERQRWFGRAWTDTQARFVDDPHAAVSDADGLVTDLMRERGYPTDNFDQQAADLSVEHADVVDNYRSAHALALLGHEATTEELRRAMVHYRTLFTTLLGEADHSVDLRTPATDTPANTPPGTPDEQPRHARRTP